MTRIVYLLFGVVAYLVFFLTFLYLMAFVGDLPRVPRTVDRGPEAAPLVAVAVNLGLVALFGFQHSLMARKSFKQAWIRQVPAPLERSFYVLFASLALILMMAFWRPLPASIWDLSGSVAAAAMWTLFGLGWLIVLISTFLINHFELFGLQQVWGHARGHVAKPPEFRTPVLYRAIRHPIYAGFILAFWATPEMSAGHMLLAVGMTFYIRIAIRLEERDLVGLFGDRYVDYRRRVGMLVPRMRGPRG